MAQDIEISRDAVKLSYKRFLSDSTPGYLLMLLVALAYHQKRLPTSVMEVGHALSRLNDTSPLGIFLVLVLFLVGTPLGLTLNAASWFLLGRVEVRVSNLLLGSRWGFVKRTLYGTRKEHAFPLLDKLFPSAAPPAPDGGPLARLGIWLGQRDPNGDSACLNAYERVRLLRETLAVHYPKLTGDTEHVVGLMMMVRTLGGVALMTGAYLGMWAHLVESLGDRAGCLFGLKLIAAGMVLPFIFRLFDLRNVRLLARVVAAAMILGGIACELVALGGWEQLTVKWITGWICLSAILLTLAGALDFYASGRLLIRIYAIAPNEIEALEGRGARDVVTLLAGMARQAEDRAKRAAAEA